jgi:hypothetical protein
MDLSTWKLQEIIDKIAAVISDDIQEKDIPSLIFRLQKLYPDRTAVEIGLALKQIVFRRKGSEKFLHPENFLYVGQSLEQATHWRISQYVASKLEGERVVDLTAGMGGDAMMFAKEGVLESAVERVDEVREVLEYNLRDFTDVQVLSDWQEVSWGDVSVAYLDPGRRDDRGYTVRSLMDWQPNLVEVLPELFTKVSKVVIKISPAFQESDLALLPNGWNLELISLGNDLKQAILWYGFDGPERVATMITREGVKLFSSEFVELDSSPKSGEEMIFYPYPGLRRARLEDAFFRSFALMDIDGFPKIGKGIYTDSLNCWGRWYQEIATVDGSFAEIRKLLAQESINQFDVIFLERLSVTDQDVYRKLKSREGGEYVLLMANGRQGKYQAMLAKRKRGG